MKRNVVEQIKNEDELEDDVNPFKMPTDEEVFLVRNREKEIAENMRHSFHQKKVWEKNAKKTNTRFVYHKPKPVFAAQHSLVERRREKENTVDFIAKKREMFLVQMSLDTKKEEIRKLEEKAKMKEEALRKSEQMLEADAIRFDKFLKENDRSAHEAIKRHDEESKAKQEKVLEIKKLNNEIAKVQSEMSKYAEQLEDCLKYKEFLDKLAPTSKKQVEEETTDERIHDEQKETIEDEEGKDSIYFTEPQQLLDIFSALEERNLFLIQNSQETEEALEELKKKYEDSKAKMGNSMLALTKNIEDLQTKIELENEKTARLAKRVSSNVGVGKQQQMLHELGQKVTEVYSRCGFNPDANPDTLDKLAEIERNLEHLIKNMASLPPEYVRAAEKRKEAERRDRVRKQKVLEKQRAYEERLAKSVARATAAIPQRTGKKIMFRSPPLKRRQKATEKEDKSKVEEEELYRKFFV